MAFAIISQIPYWLFYSTITTSAGLNIFFTLLLGLTAVTIYDKINNKILSLSICAVLLVIAELINVDYGYWGVLIIIVFHIFKDKKILMSLLYELLCIIKFLPELVTFNFHYLILGLCISTMLSLVFVLLYNGKQGKKIKYILYIFYPVHLLLIYMLRVAFM